MKRKTLVPLVLILEALKSGSVGSQWVHETRGNSGYFDLSDIVNSPQDLPNEISVISTEEYVRRKSQLHQVVFDLGETSRSRVKNALDSLLGSLH